MKNSYKTACKAIRFFILSLFIFWGSIQLCFPQKKILIKESERPSPPKWYTEARFGMFYHWGLYTGGKGHSSTMNQNGDKFKYEKSEDLEEAISPDEFGRNLVQLTKMVGAKYLILTLTHSCDKFFVIYPTNVKNFLYKANEDYLAAVIKHAKINNIKVICYFPAAPHHYNSKGGPYLTGFPNDWRSKEAGKIWEETIYDLFRELKGRYGNSIDGFWMDGYMSWKGAMEFFPEAVRIGNNHSKFETPGTQITASEFPVGDLAPSYNRPSGLNKPIPYWGDNHLAPRKDFNEDIPSCNGWWNKGEIINNEYTQDPTFWVKQMICSLGQRRIWNYTMGFGPLINGTPPAEMKPMLQKMAAFMEWAYPAIYNTVGGEGAPIQQGWLNSGAFASLTVSKEEKNTYYLLVTEPPTKFTTSELKVQHDWVQVESIHDLRTGESVTFKIKGSIDIQNDDWSDINKFGAKVFRIVLKDRYIKG